MLDQFEAYILERENAVLLKHEHGFAIYKDLTHEYGYLQDVFVQSEHRQSGIGKQLLEQAKLQATTSMKIALVTSTDVTANNAETSIVSILKCGFKVLSIENNKVIWYIMPLNRTKNG